MMAHELAKDILAGCCLYSVKRRGACMRNIEIKARTSDIESAEEAAVRVCGGGPAALLRQTDTYFNVPAGRLKLRESDRAAESELIYYERPDEPGPRSSVYLIVRVGDARDLLAVLKNALGVKVVVRKTRRLYLHGNTRIHLDEVDGLGTFIELECVMAEQGDRAEGEREVRELMRELGIVDVDLEKRSYSDILAGLSAT